MIRLHYECVFISIFITGYDMRFGYWCMIRLWIIFSQFFRTFNFLIDNYINFKAIVKQNGFLFFVILLYIPDFFFLIHPHSLLITLPLPSQNLSGNCEAGLRETVCISDSTCQVECPRKHTEVEFSVQEVYWGALVVDTCGREKKEAGLITGKCQAPATASAGLACTELKRLGLLTPKSTRSWMWGAWAALCSWGEPWRCWQHWQHSQRLRQHAVPYRGMGVCVCSSHKPLLDSSHN